MSPILPLVVLVASQGSADSALSVPPCYHEDNRGGVRILVYDGDRKCVPLREPRTYEGVWINDFEGSRFAENTTDANEVLAQSNRIWFNPYDTLVPLPANFRAYYGHVYRVRFVGREAVDMKRKGLEGYGHFGMSEGLILADQMISIEDITPPERLESWRRLEEQAKAEKS